MHSLEAEREASERRLKHAAAAERAATSAAEDTAKARVAKRNAERRAVAAEGKVAEAFKKAKDAEAEAGKLRKRAHCADGAAAAAKAEAGRLRSAAQEAETKLAAAISAAVASDARAGKAEEGARKQSRANKELSDKLGALEAAAREAMAQATRSSAEAAEASAEAAAAATARRAAAALREERDSALSEADRARERCARLAPLRDEVVRLRARCEAAAKEKALFKRAVKALKRKLDAVEGRCSSRSKALTPAPPPEQQHRQQHVVEASPESEEYRSPEAGVGVEGALHAHAASDAAAAHVVAAVRANASSSFVGELAGELNAARQLTRGLLEKTQRRDNATESLLAAVCEENAALRLEAGLGETAATPLLPPGIARPGVAPSSLERDPLVQSNRKMRAEISKVLTPCKAMR